MGRLPRGNRGNRPMSTLEMSTTSWINTWRSAFHSRQAGDSTRRRRAARRTTRLCVEHLESRSLLSAAPAPGLVSWYRAEGDASDFAGGFDGALENGATFA